MKMTKQLFKGTNALLRFHVKRDGLQLLLWSIIILVFTVSLAFLFPNLMPTAEQRQEFSQVMKNPAMVFIVGPGYGFDNYTLGAMFAHFMLLYTGMIVGILNIIFFARYTRGDEEEGKHEIVRALPVGQLAPLTSASIFLIGVNLLFGLATGIGLSITGIESMDVLGSFTFAFSIASTGIFFMVMTGLFAQLTQTSRGTIGYSIAFLLLAYLIRGFGEVQSLGIAWLSPLHWLIRSEAYVRNLWWPILLTLIVSIAIALFTYILHMRRDLGAGLLPEKAGRTNAGRWLRTPFQLLLKLQRVPMIAWSVGIMAIAASYGSIFGDMEKMLEIEMIEDILPDILGYSIEERFLSFIVIIIALISLIPALLVIFHLKKEEFSGRLDQIYARPITRLRIYFSHLLLAILFAFGLLILAGIGLWGAMMSVMSDPIPCHTVLAAAINPLPAIIVILGLASLLVGFVPKLTNILWVYYGYSFVIVYLGNMLDIPKWVRKLSPFGWIPAYPTDSLKPLTILALLVISIAFMAIGYVGYRKRDLETR